VLPGSHPNMRGKLGLYQQCCCLACNLVGCLAAVCFNAYFCKLRNCNQREDTISSVTCPYIGSECEVFPKSASRPVCRILCIFSTRLDNDSITPGNSALRGNVLSQFTGLRAQCFSPLSLFLQLISKYLSISCCLLLNEFGRSREHVPVSRQCSTIHYWILCSKGEFLYH
jgi:hypothetical protein